MPFTYLFQLVDHILRRVQPFCVLLTLIRILLIHDLPAKALALRNLRILQRYRLPRQIVIEPLIVLPELLKIVFLLY